MPHRLSSFGAFLACATFTLSAGHTAAAPLTPIEAPGQRMLFPGVPHAHFAYDSWQSQFGGSFYADLERFTWPDASMITVGSADGASLGPFGTFATSIDPWGGAIDDRKLSRATDQRWVVAAGNREWSLRYADDAFARRARLVARDVTGRIRSVAVAPTRGGRPQFIVPTSGGLRLVTQSAKGLALVDRRWHPLAAYRFPRAAQDAEDVFVADAEPLTDGSVVVSVLDESRRQPSRIVRLRPGRRAQVLRSGPLVRRLVRAADGVIGIDDAGGVVAVDDRGRLRTRRRGQLGLPASIATCSSRQRVSAGSLVATSGRAVVALACGADYPNRGIAIEFDGTARTHAAYDLAPVGPIDPASANGHRLVAAETPLADGSLPYPTISGLPEESATGWSTWLPAGSVAPIRGRVKLSVAPMSERVRSARASVTCRAPYGQICSGRIELRAGDQLLGATRYALPGRPGRAAARDRFDIPLGAEVAPADLRLTAVPLPPRPLLSPPKPSWDTSIPW